MTKILVISDTHDNMLAIDRISDIVKKGNYDYLIHCGDHVSPFSFNKVISLENDVKEILTVLGNNEGEIYKIASDYTGRKNDNIRLDPNFLNTEIRGETILITHGWGSVDKTRKILFSLGKSGDYKFIFFGHTHIPELTFVTYDNELITRVYGEVKDSVFNFHIDEYKSVIINPGEASGWLFGRKTYVELEIDDEKNVKINFRFIP